jgi:hypothetical protein
MQEKSDVCLYISPLKRKVELTLFFVSLKQKRKRGRQSHIVYLSYLIPLLFRLENLLSLILTSSKGTNKGEEVNFHL